MGRIDRQKKSLKQLFSLSDAASYITGQPLYRWRIYSELIETIQLLRELFQISALMSFCGEEIAPVRRRN